MESEEEKRGDLNLFLLFPSFLLSFFLQTLCFFAATLTACFKLNMFKLPFETKRRITSGRGLTIGIRSECASMRN